MTHSAHEGCDERQIWKDNCDECEHRSKSLPDSMATLDSAKFVLAWRRAADWNKDREVGHISDAERPLLELLWRFQVMFERVCKLPIGELPFRHGTEDMHEIAPGVWIQDDLHRRPVDPFDDFEVH